MNKQEYADYQTRVAGFIEREGIRNLSTGHLVCPECGIVLWGGKCPIHGLVNEPYFSYSVCDCCGTSLGGDREHATGYNPTTKQIQEYTICEDCAYYSEYCRLDDRTMDEIENTQ